MTTQNVTLTKTKPANGFVLARSTGTNGTPVVTIVTIDSANAKTGPMLQTWILSDGDQTPHATTLDGTDAGVCGNCKHRGARSLRASGHDASHATAEARTCYVRTYHAPNSVYRAHRRGVYPDYSAEFADDTVDLAQALPTKLLAKLAAKLVRAGSYGDPALVSAKVWERLKSVCKPQGSTGYTHMWTSETIDPQLKHHLMASADSTTEATQARAMGWRTFRVMQPNDTLDAKTEVLCPASAEGGRKATCATCLLCAGTSSKSTKSVAIYIH